MSDVEESSKNPEPPPAPDGDLVDSPAPDLEARRRAAAVLEVLGGAKTPAEAAEALGITLATYYLLESRALEGLVAACEPRSRGRSSAPARTLQALKRENDRLRQDLSRTQALARAVQRAAGMPVNEDDGNPSRVQSRRRPRARALRAARLLAPPTAPPAPSFPPPSPPGPEAPRVESPP